MAVHIFPKLEQVEVANECEAAENIGIGELVSDSVLTFESSFPLML